MNILGIDYGRKKIGLALAESNFSLATPLSVLRFGSVEEAIEKIKKIKEVEGVDKIVVGLSEGAMAEESKRFGELLQEKLRIEVVFQDETLSTKEAQRMSIEAGKRRKKRRQMEDAYSAALILQAYFDQNISK